SGAGRPSRAPTDAACVPSAEPASDDGGVFAWLSERATLRNKHGNIGTSQPGDAGEMVGGQWGRRDSDGSASCRKMHGQNGASGGGRAMVVGTSGFRSQSAFAGTPRKVCNRHGPPGKAAANSLIVMSAPAGSMRKGAVSPPHALRPRP